MSLKVYKKLSRCCLIGLPGQLLPKILDYTCGQLITIKERANALRLLWSRNNDHNKRTHHHHHGVFIWVIRSLDLGGGGGGGAGSYTLFGSVDCVWLLFWFNFVCGVKTWAGFQDMFLCFSWFVTHSAF